MRKLSILLLVLMMSLLTACSDGGTVSAPSPAPPQEPATPQDPERESSKSPATPLAVLPSYTPEPAPTSTPIPTATPVSAKVKQELRDENLQRCRHWALNNLPPLVFNEFDSLNPYEMTDLQRVLWSDQLNGDIRRGEGLWCQDYWSEELNASNASKRNDQFYYACKKNLVNRGVEFERGVRRDYQSNPGDMSPLMVNQHVRLLNWLDITGDDLLSMDQRPDQLIRRLVETAESMYTENHSAGELSNFPRKGAPSEVIEWWGIEGLWDDFPDCRAYYPQLFLGRWIPVDTYGMESKIQKVEISGIGGAEKIVISDDNTVADESYKELIKNLSKDESQEDSDLLENLSKETRDRDNWPDWADQKDRDILIRLEN